MTRGPAQDLFAETMPTAGRFRTLVLAHPRLWSEIERVTTGLMMELECLADAGLFVSRLESDRPDIVLFDADTRWANADLVTFSRSLWPTSPVFALVHPWSERADALRDVVDGLLLKPPRAVQWHAVLARRWRATPQASA